MKRMITDAEWREDRYRTLCAAYSPNSKEGIIVRHYGPEELDYAEADLRRHFALLIGPNTENQLAA